MFAVNHGVAFFFHNDRPDNLRIEHTPIDQSTQVNNRAYPKLISPKKEKTSFLLMRLKSMSL